VQVVQRRIRRGVSAVFDALGYRIQRKRPARWGDDALLDQQRLLEGSPVRVVMDVGANLGETVQQYRAAFPGAAVYAFEPFPEVYRELARRFAADTRVRTCESAVTDAGGTRRFYVNDVHYENSLFPLHPAAAGKPAAASPQRQDRIIEVRAITIDEFCAAEGLSDVDLLKMDIQGGEALALEGAARLLGRRAVRVVYLEVLFAPLYEGQAYFCDVTRVLNRHGYHLFGLYNLVHREDGLGWADAIFRPA
jgi:FkbM family methyltransferase